MPSLSEPVVADGYLRALAQPTLDADGLLVRPWRADDVAAVFEAYQDQAIRRWHVRTMADLAEATAWIDAWAGRWRAETGADWAVTADGTVVGRVGIRAFELWDGIGELAYWVLPSARGRRVAPRAVSAVAGWALDVLGLHRLELVHAIENDASCQVAGRTGFALEGTMRGPGRHADGWHDMHLHARVAGDGPPGKRRPASGRPTA